MFHHGDIRLAPIFWFSYPILYTATGAAKATNHITGTLVNSALFIARFHRRRQHPHQLRYLHVTWLIKILDTELDSHFPKFKLSCLTRYTGTAIKPREYCNHANKRHCLSRTQWSAWPLATIAGMHVSAPKRWPNWAETSVKDIRSDFCVLHCEAMTWRGGANFGSCYGLGELGRSVARAWPCRWRCNPFIVAQDYRGCWNGMDWLLISSLST